MDGDGSMFLVKSRSVVRPGLSIGLSLTAEGLLATGEFHSLYGGSKSISFSHTRINPRNRPTCRWDLIGSAVFSALDDLDCALVLKKQQARLLIAHRHLFPGISGKPISDYIRKERCELKLKLESVRAEAQTTTVKQYSMHLAFDKRLYEQQCAYIAGFCDADAYFGCVPSGKKFRYVVSIVQKNHAFLQAVKDTVLGGTGSNVRMRSDGVSCLHVGAESDVQELCGRIRAYSIMKANQLDVIMSEPPSARARDALVSMHGNQGNKNK